MNEQTAQEECFFIQTGQGEVEASHQPLILCDMASYIPYKLICCDIDGTLLDSRLQISEKSITSIRKAYRENHCLLSLCSGRFRAGLKFLREKLDVPGPTTCFNGAYTEAEGHILINKPIEECIIGSVLKIASEESIVTLCFSLDDWFIEKNGYWHTKQIQMSGFEGHILTPLKTLEYVKQNDTPIYKILAKDKNPCQLNRLKEILDCKFRETLSVYYSSPTNLEIVCKGVDKKDSLEALASYYSIQKSQIIAFGDYYNDIGMIEAAGMGIAMGNAPDDVKSHANFVTLDNDNEGLSFALDLFISKPCV